MSYRLGDHITYDKKTRVVACSNQGEREYAGVRYRECPTYVGYIAGSDGTIWKGYLDEPRELWKPVRQEKTHNVWGVWVQLKDNQCKRRTAELVLDAWRVQKRGRYIGYKDGNPDNLHPDNLYYAFSKQIPKDLSKDNTLKVIRGIHALAAVEYTAEEIARAMRRPIAYVERILSQPRP
jgi:hypothetical protein